MFGLTDLMAFAEANGLKHDAVQRFISANPIYETQRETQFTEYTNDGTQGAVVVMPPGTKVKVMQCLVPGRNMVVVDIIGGDKYYYWADLRHMTRVS